MQSIRFTLPMSASETKLVWVRLRFLLVDILVKMWLLKAFFLVILPVPVSEKRFLALELVFIFGMSLYLYLLINACLLASRFKSQEPRFKVFLTSYLASWFYFLDPFGVTVKNIRLPSSLGNCSTLPCSSSAWAKRKSSISPCSLYTMARPLKCT